MTCPSSIASQHIIHIDFYCEADVALLTLRPSSFSLTLSLQNRPGSFAYPLPGDGEAVLGPDRRLVALQCGGGN